MYPGILFGHVHGDLLIAAAGNDSLRIVKEGLTGPKNYPASYNEVLAIGSVTHVDNRAGYSNYGNEVIGAPGNLWSTSLGGGVGFDSGTSFAAPLATALAALIWSNHSGLDALQVRNTIINSADIEISVYPDTFDLGRINAYRALRLADNDPVIEKKFPGRPSWKDPWALGGDGYVAIHWDPPTTYYDGTPFDGQIGGYYVYRKLASGGNLEWELRASVGGGASQFVDQQVINGWTYDYRVSAGDVDGQEGYWTEEFLQSTATSNYNYVRGLVRDPNGDPIESVPVAVSGDGNEVYMTDEDGYYFAHLPHGLSYTFMPIKTGWSFSPASRSYNPLNSNQDDQNYVGTQLAYYYIKGRVRDSFGSGVAGVSVTLSGAVTDEDTTGSDGYYEFLDLEGGLSYTVTPTKTYWVFDPDNIPFDPLDEDKDDQDFAGTPYYYIKGYVRADGVPMEGVWVELSGATSEYDQTNASGYYEFLNLEGLLNYTVRPSKEGWYFDPDDSVFAPLDGNKDNVDFEGHEIQTHFYIKGYVYDSYRAPMESVTVTLSGGASDTYVTGPSGYYEFLELPGGPDYTVTPTKPAWRFDPPDTQFTPLNSDQDEVNFTGTLCPLYDIMGYVLDTLSVGISDVVVYLTGAASDSYITASDGYYEFLDLQGCMNYTVSPSKQGLCFSPPARDYAPLVADQDSQNFIATPCPPDSDFKVTDFVSGNALRPAISTNNAGSFVLGWQDDRLGYDYEIFTQRYVSIAEPVGSNFKVNDAGAPWMYQYTGIAITTNGNFVLAWRDSRNLNQSKDIYSQRYDSSGTALGSNFIVDTDVTNTCDRPDVGICGSGTFTIVWHDSRNGNQDVFAQRYDSSGTALGSNFTVSDVTTQSQVYAAIAVNSSGKFVVCWEDDRSMSYPDVYCRRYSSTGSGLGPSFKVNSGSIPVHHWLDSPDVAIDNSGNFVVVWGIGFSALPEDSFHIYGQRYNSSGTPQGSNFIVDDSNVETTHPAVAMDVSGNSVIVWSDRRNGDSDIYGQKYNSSGSPIGSNFRIDDDATSGGAYNPDVSANGTYIYVTWQDEREGFYGIYAKVIPWSP